MIDDFGQLPVINPLSISASLHSPWLHLHICFMLNWWEKGFRYWANITAATTLTIKEAPAQSSPETHVAQARVYYQVVTSG